MPDDVLELCVESRGPHWTRLSPLGHRLWVLCNWGSARGTEQFMAWFPAAHLDELVTLGLATTDCLPTVKGFEVSEAAVVLIGLRNGDG